MRKLIGRLMARWREFYRKSSIQFILSLSFTAAAVVGMVFMGITLFLRFSSTNNAQLAASSQFLRADQPGVSA